MRISIMAGGSSSRPDTWMQTGSAANLDKPPLQTGRAIRYLGRVFAAHGHDVRLMSPEYVRPYIKAQKNDDRDAEGIAEAATRPTMRFVELKSQDQLDMQTLHRSRDRLVGERTALINQLRAILLEARVCRAAGQAEASAISRRADG